MAIYHCSIKPISRSTGRSAPAAAAYRAGVELVNERDGLVHDYAKRGGVDAAEIILPTGIDAEWARDRSSLWNAAESAERRRDARVAREVVIALPHELDATQRLALTRDFAQSLADRYGVAVDFAIHQPNANGDERNVHAHLMLTTRQVEAGGLGAKSLFERQDKALRAAGLPSAAQQVSAVRELWADRANEHLHAAGFDLRIDHRSHQERGLEIEPTQHQGVKATAMQRRGEAVERVKIEPEAAQRNAERILARPGIVLDLVAAEKSVFDHRDVARVVHRYVDDAQFQAVYAAVLASPELVRLDAAERQAGEPQGVARYSTAGLVEIEAGMARAADRLAEGTGFESSERRVSSVLESGSVRLSDEQAGAVRAITGDRRIAAVVGLAGAGKSTMLHAARRVWEADGHRVFGAALAGKAAEGLEESSGIESRTLASWLRSWDQDTHRLGRGDVMVLDEAGMVASPQLARVLEEADRAGAKVVLVGDPEQLQPIGPGAAFRAVVERVGCVELAEVRRQREDWQREASRAFGQQQTRQALDAYEAHGHVHVHQDGGEVQAAITRAYVQDMDMRPDGSRLVLAHRNVDVQALNDSIRQARRERGELAGEREYRTAQGVRAFAAGDRLLFRENNRQLAVKNGMLGTVVVVEDGRVVVRLDDQAGPGQGRAVRVEVKDYAAIDHGYAATIHKSQGATVDRVWVQAAPTMDRHLAYVAMTRHRDQVEVHVPGDGFGGGSRPLVFAALQRRWSRSQAKETTLDYRDAYAGRRGFDPIQVRERQAAPLSAEVQATAAAGMAKFRAAYQAHQEAQRVREAAERERVEKERQKQAEREPVEKSRQKGRDDYGWSR